MEGFCRTCGKTVDAERCTIIFSPVSRRILHTARTITNCWVENVAGFPIYVCKDCQTLLRKIIYFRKRCAKIEAFLNQRKPKLNSSNGISPAISEQAKITNDPLRIEEPETELETVDIKMEATNTHQDQIEKDVDKINESYYEEPPAYDDCADLSVDENTEEPLPPTAVTAQTTVNSKKKIKSKSHYTMRVGKRTMYIKLTNDQQPKRIVDRERQWASSRPCICEHCGRQFKDGSNLNVHLLRHTGTKKYECKECNEKCYTLHLLRRHQLKHTEGPYECTFCGLQYSTNSSRVRHEREACKKGRAPQSNTEIIKRGERTFHCDVCDLWFLRAGNLTQHLNSSVHFANARLKNKKSKLKQNKPLDITVGS